MNLYQLNRFGCDVTQIQDSLTRALDVVPHINSTKWFFDSTQRAINFEQTLVYGELVNDPVIGIMEALWRESLSQSMILLINNQIGSQLSYVRKGKNTGSLYNICRYKETVLMNLKILNSEFQKVSMYPTLKFIDPKLHNILISKIKKRDWDVEKHSIRYVDSPEISDLKDKISKMDSNDEPSDVISINQLKSQLSNMIDKHKLKIQTDLVAQIRS